MCFCMISCVIPGNQKSGIRPVWLVPGVAMCDQLLDNHIKTYMSKRWSMCSELFWIDFSNVTVFRKHFWNYPLDISLVTSTSFFFFFQPHSFTYILWWQMTSVENEFDIWKKCEVILNWVSYTKLGNKMRNAIFS